MKTLEFSVGKLGSDLHNKVRMKIMMSRLGGQYSAGGDPYIVRLVIPAEAEEEAKKFLVEAGVPEDGITVLEGAQSF